jgi:hypothetical protein
MEPIFRYGTTKAINKLSDELNLPYESWMQDWPYEVTIPEDIDKYISHYDLEIDEDKKFVIMQMILQALFDQSDEQIALSYWEKVSAILIKDFLIHEYTIYYWKDFGESEFENSKILSPLLEQLWKSKTSED